MPTALRTGAVLVFDGDCGFCTTSVTWLSDRFPGAFAIAPYQRVDLDSLGLTARECDEKVQWIGDVTAPVTTRAEGAAAVGRLLQAGGRVRGPSVSRSLGSTDLKRLHREWRRQAPGRLALHLDSVATPANVGSIQIGRAHV